MLIIFDSYNFSKKGTMIEKIAKKQCGAYRDQDNPSLHLPLSPGVMRFGRSLFESHSTTLNHKTFCGNYFPAKSVLFLD